MNIRNRSSLEPLRIDEPRGGSDGLRELLTPPMPIKSPTRLYDNIENELLREQLLATSAESPAEAFVKRLLNPSPASRSKTEELLREQLAASESRAAAAEASLAESTTQAKESALENEDLHELAASEATFAALPDLGFAGQDEFEAEANRASGCRRYVVVI